MSGQHSQRVMLPDGTDVAVIGQGTWNMGENASARGEEIKALQMGIDLGMTLIDTAEMYADGEAEKIVGEAIKGKRDSVFIVTKAYPHHADSKGLAAACEASLKRLGTDYADLYLLHWRGSIPLEETVQGMEKLCREGKIRRWGVSNLDTSDIEELWRLPDGTKCAVNQVLYHAASRGIEHDLLPWCREHRVPVMAYCPIAQGGRLRKELLQHPLIRRLAENHGASPAQIALAWVIRSGDVIAIPKAVQEAHVRENAEAARIVLTEEELLQIDDVFSAPKRKMPLDIV
ncbi:aldo/keto reductase [Paenibacillus sp. P96]|uniref:Aldo/keto reductase n=1 Tax=Paenibacillus zeirhizosphaerae TaxID=2987519 RepID=A0ABT9FWQ7_9BACL|nr:aldo/keto reductase [Paenibacillus sp. P96]MDP4099069.1 aldo/keto reductase [Paenibacillus sp. P96]